jgi:hypothetical protein
MFGTMPCRWAWLIDNDSDVRDADGSIFYCGQIVTSALVR